MSEGLSLRASILAGFAAVGDAVQASLDLRGHAGRALPEHLDGWPHVDDCDKDFGLELHVAIPFGIAGLDGPRPKEVDLLVQVQPLAYQTVEWAGD